MDRRGQECPDFFSAGYFSGLLTRVRIYTHRRSISLVSLERACIFSRVRFAVTTSVTRFSGGPPRFTDRARIVFD